MYVKKAVFAKYLQEYETKIYWVSGSNAPHNTIIHEWRLLLNHQLILKEINTADQSSYWIDKSLL